MDNEKKNVGEESFLGKLLKKLEEMAQKVVMFPVNLYRRWEDYQAKLRERARKEIDEKMANETKKISDDPMFQRVKNGEKLQMLEIAEKDMPMIEKALGKNEVLFKTMGHSKDGVKILAFFEEDAKKIGAVLDGIRTDELIRAAAKTSLKQHEEGSKEQGKNVVKKVLAHAADLDREAIAKDPLNLRHVKYQTPELCLCAVHNNGHALEFVKNQTPQICMFAVQERGSALQFVKEQAPELCREAVRRDPNAIRFVKDQTEDLCMSAVKKDPFSLKYIKNPSLSVCKEAVRNNVHAAHLVPEQLKGQFTGALAKSNEIRQAQKMPSFAKGPSFGRGR